MASSSFHTPGPGVSLFLELLTPVPSAFLAFNPLPLVLKRVKAYSRDFLFKKAIERNTTLKLMEHIKFQTIAFSYFLIRLCGFE